MVSGHLEIKKGYYYVVLSYLDVNGKGTDRGYRQDFPKRETNERRRQSLHEFAAPTNRRRRWKI